MYPSGDYDVVVVGTGHAGCEAALAAARLGCRTLALTVNLDNVALMPCNPAIGGPAKGHLVREIDALGGEMGLVADATYLQMRTLNTGKGPAVRALRAQVDKKRYQAEMRRRLESQPGLDLQQGMVTRVVADGDELRGVATVTGMFYRAAAVVLTTGVYMEGRVLVGDVARSSGPNGQVPSFGLSDSLRGLGLELGRFKTGTPPRVDRRSVDFSALVPHAGDDAPRAFSFLTVPEAREQLPCWLTYTTPRTHDIIRRNLHRSPLYNGAIRGVGPRYCPSIEDKVVRFAEKERHQVFLEPEGWDTAEMYVLGVSTSLPEDVQVEVLRSIPGLEKVRVIRFGYAIEYDYLMPTQLKPWLETRKVKGLFAAGQVNGTSGYEEAAAQGLIAGANAALYVRGEEPLVPERSDGYIGVLLDDLVTKGVTEPYRMMTSLAEYRLLLRMGNADLRLTEMGRRAGLVSDERYARYQERKTAIEGMRRRLEEEQVTPSPGVQEALRAIGSAELRRPASLADVLRRPEVGYGDLRRLQPSLPVLPADVEEEVEVQVKYAGYIEKQEAQVERYRRLETRRLPADMDYETLRGISSEARQKLARLRPVSVGQAMRITGVSPADISALMVHLERRRREGACS